jgi:hypothetical protein
MSTVLSLRSAAEQFARRTDECDLRLRKVRSQKVVKDVQPDLGAVIWDVGMPKTPDASCSQPTSSSEPKCRI